MSDGTSCGSQDVEMLIEIGVLDGAAAIDEMAAKVAKP